MYKCYPLINDEHIRTLRKFSEILNDYANTITNAAEIMLYLYGAESLDSTLLDKVLFTVLKDIQQAESEIPGSIKEFAKRIRDISDGVSGK